MDATPDGGSLLFAWHSGNADLLRIDPAGRVLWARRFAGVEQLRVVRSTGSGGAFVAFMRETTGPFEIQVCRLDPSGTVLWARAAGTASDQSLYVIGSERRMLDVCVTSELGVVVSYCDFSTSPFVLPVARVFRLAPDGTPLWSKLVQAEIPLVPGFPDANFPLALDVSGSGSVALLLRTTSGGPTVVQLDPSGSLVSSRGLTCDSGLFPVCSDWSVSEISYSANSLWMSGTRAIAKLGVLAGIELAKSLGVDVYDLDGSHAVTPDGGLVKSGTDLALDGGEFVARFGSDGSVLWSSGVASLPGQSRHSLLFGDVALYGANRFRVAGVSDVQSLPGPRELRLHDVDLDGLSASCTEPMPLLLQDIPVQVETRVTLVTDAAVPYSVAESTLDVTAEWSHAATWCP